VLVLLSLAEWQTSRANQKVTYTLDVDLNNGIYIRSNCATTQMSRQRLLNADRFTATHCNKLQHTATHYNIHCNTLQHTTTHCNTLQHTATHGNTLQHTTTHCNAFHYSTLQRTQPPKYASIVYCVLTGTLQHTATHANTLQHTANTLQHTATRCNTLHHTAASYCIC